MKKKKTTTAKPRKAAASKPARRRAAGPPPKGKPMKAILLKQDIEQPRKPGEQVHIVSDGPVHVVLDNTIPGGFRMEPI